MTVSPAFRQIAPYAAWMALMTWLPATAGAYAVRTAATFALLLFSFRAFRPPTRLAGVFGLLAGIGVFVVWVAPDFLLHPVAAASPSPYAPETCGWALTLVRVFGSAFVIPVAEELFFRRWLLDFAGFGWMVGLFAVEHLRLDQGRLMGAVYVAEGAFAGYVYGRLAQRHGLRAAVVAHVVTNFLLAVLAVVFGQWQFW